MPPIMNSGSTYYNLQQFARAIIFQMRRVIPTCLLFAVTFTAATLPPEADRQLAHDIYKQIVEIKSGYTTGATTPVLKQWLRG